MSDILVEVMSKDQKYINFILWGIPNDLSKFYVSYIWYIIFISVWGIMFFFNYSRYSSLEIKYVISGLIICIMGLATHNYITSYNWLYKATDNKFFHRNKSNSMLNQKTTDKYIVVLNPENVKLKNFNENTYIFTTNEFEKFKRKYKLQTTTFDNYVSTKSNSKWNERQLKWGTDEDMGMLWDGYEKNMQYVPTILLTFAFVVASWKIKLFYKIFPWLIVSLIPQLISIFWFKYGTFKERGLYMFIIERLHMLSCYFAIYTLILFMSFSQK